MLPAISAALPHVKTGRLRALGVSTAEPTKLAPGIPTISSAGLPGYVAESQNAVFAPVETPPAVIRRFNQALNETLNLAEIRDKLLSGGTEPTPGYPEAAGEMVKAEMAKWGKVVEALGIRTD